MKKFACLAFMVAFAALHAHVFGQNADYPFDVKVSGRGSQAIIFIPGFASSGQVWDSTLPLFDKEFTCHTLTMAGFAGTPAQANPTFQNWERSIAAYIQREKFGKAIIIGHSMGGGLAMALAADYPDLVSKIVVVDGLPCLSALMNPKFKVKEANDCSGMGSRFKAISDTQFYQMQKKGMQRLLADTSKLEMVVSWSMKSDRTTFAEMFCDFSNTDLREKVSSIQCAALILLESPFSNFKPAINDQFKLLKTASLQYATKGLHFVMYDDSEWYHDQVRNFVK